jgi:hypothetical protein
MIPEISMRKGVITVQKVVLETSRDLTTVKYLISGSTTSLTAIELHFPSVMNFTKETYQQELMPYQDL